MKILQLCLKPPLPAKDGGCIAMNNITQGLLQAGHKVKVLTIYTQKHDFQPENMPQSYLDATDIEGVYVDTTINAVEAFANFMTDDSYNITRFFSTDFDIRISKLLRRESFDIIHLESLFMTVYLSTIRRYSRAAVVLRAHNIEHVIWEKIATGTENPFKRIYLRYLSKKLKSYELENLNAVSGIATISEDDTMRVRALSITKPVCTIPFGIDMHDYPTSDKTPELALFHLGAMDWAPNQEGIQWFLDHVWPSVHSLFPHLPLYLAGRNMSDELRSRQFPNVHMVGEIDDAKTFIDSKAIMIVPLLSGGGIRVKIIEGLAMRKAIVSTSLGIQGIGCENGREAMVADTVEEWITSIRLLIEQPEKIKSLGDAGHELSRKFNNAAITERLIQFYQDLKQK
jgi:polysaccharide biosynthesis protein PslH